MMILNKANAENCEYFDFFFFFFTNFFQLYSFFNFLTNLLLPKYSNELRNKLYCKLDDDKSKIFYFFLIFFKKKQVVSKHLLRIVFEHARKHSKLARDPLFYVRFSQLFVYPEWHVAHDELVSIATVLLQGELLPPYCLLEVYNCIGDRWKLPQARKMQTILKVRDSLQAIRQKQK